MSTRHEIGERILRAADRIVAPPPSSTRDRGTAPRTPLTTNQHILHLLLSIVTCGLWLPVWFVRAWQGNPAPLADPAGCAGLTPAPGSPEPREKGNDG
jgi:hypothetical protein